ncbi:MAG TPA: FxsA family protein [Catenuloplanes sp.]
MRRTMTWAPLALLLTALVEILVFVLVARAVDAGWAVLGIAVLSLAGVLLLRREGMRAWRRFRTAAQRDEPPGGNVIDGLVGLLGALLLAVPGFVTGLVGFLLLAPPLRWAARAGVRRATERRVSSAVAGDLFGPRRVRVRRGRAPAPTKPAGPPPAAAALTGEIVEGEIVPVPPRVGGG